MADDRTADHQEQSRSGSGHRSSSPAHTPEGGASSALTPWGKPDHVFWLTQQNGNSSRSWSASSSSFVTPSSSAFPSLSASSIGPAMRSRHSPWRNAINGPVWNPNRTRMQDLQERVLSRQLDERSTNQTGTVGMTDFDHTSDESDQQPGYRNDSGGQTQMYGLSRVIVTDLSRPGATSKGKNKAKRQDCSSAGGPQIYGRHNTPYVQKGRARRDDLEQIEEVDRISNGTAYTAESLPKEIIGDEKSLLPFCYLNSNEPTTPTIEEVMSKCDRDMRAFYAHLRLTQTNYLRDPIPRPLPDATFPLYEKLSNDLATPSAVLKADWLDPSLPRDLSIREKLASLNASQDEEACQVISRKMVAFCCRVEAAAQLPRFWQAAESIAPVCLTTQAILRLLQTCLVLGHNRDPQEAFPRIMLTMVRLSYQTGRPSGLAEALAALVTVDQHQNFLESIAHRLRDLIEDCLLSPEDRTLRGHITTIVDAFQLFHTTFLAIERRLHRPAFVVPAAFAIDAIATKSEVMSRERHLAPLLRASKYAFLQPLRYKLQVLSAHINWSKEQARKEALWSSFYRPTDRRTSRKERQRTSITYPGQDGNASSSMLLTISVRRESLFLDTLDAFAELEPHSTISSCESTRLPSALQHELRIHFEGEEGVDSLSGGLRKEWFSEVVNGLLRSRTVVPIEVEASHRSADHAGDNERFVHISPQADDRHAKAVGVMLALSLYHGVPLGFRFPNYLLRYILASDTVSHDILSPALVEKSSLDGSGKKDAVDQNLLDLAQYRPQLVRSLEELLSWSPAAPRMETSIDQSSQASDAGANGLATNLFEAIYSLNWTVSLPYSDATDGAAETIPLVKGGQHRPVTLSNRLSYVQTLTTFHLFTVVRPQLLAVRRGFGRVWPAPSAKGDADEGSGRTYLTFWQPSEIARVCQGDAGPLEVAHLRKYVEVAGRRSSAAGKKEDGMILKWFWEVVLELEELHQYRHASRSVTEETAAKRRGDGSRAEIARKLLRYVTSSSTLPLSLPEAIESARTEDGHRLHYRHDPPPAPPPVPKRPFTICLLDTCPSAPPIIVDGSIEDVMRSAAHSSSSPSSSAHACATWPLPFTSTCTETLFLPRYPSQAVMREKVASLFGLLLLDSDHEVDDRQEGGKGDHGGIGIAFGLK